MLLSVYNICKFYPSSKCILVKASADTRSPGNLVSSHDFDAVNADIVTNCLHSVPLETFDSNHCTHLFIDEGQFISSLRSSIEMIISCNPTIEIHIAALNGDRDQHMFKEICDILPIANVISKYAICCDCKKRNAVISKLKIGTPETVPLRFIGGLNEYDVYCIVCSLKKR